MTTVGQAEFEIDLLLRYRRECGHEPNLGLPDCLLFVTPNEARDCWKKIADGNDGSTENSAMETLDKA